MEVREVFSMRGRQQFARMECDRAPSRPNHHFTLTKSFQDG